MNHRVEAIKRAIAWAKKAKFPSNEVARELRNSISFVHNDASVPTGHHSSNHLCDLLAGLIVTTNRQAVLEIGTLFGYSTVHLAEALIHTSGHLDTVDLRVPERKWNDGQVVKNIHEAAIRFVTDAGYSSLVTFHAGNSTHILPRLMLDGREFDLIFIDGSHSRYTVTLDVINACNLLTPGGILVFDDVGEAISIKPFHHGGPNSILPGLFASGRFDMLCASMNTLVAFDRRDIS